MNEAVSGWILTTVGDVVSFEYGRSLPAHTRRDGSYLVFGSSGPVGRHDQYLIDGPGVIVGRKGTVGALNWSDSPFWPIDTTYYLQPKAQSDLRWLYWKLQTLGLRGLDTSTGVPGLNRNDAYELRLGRPPIAEQQRIAEILDTLEGQIRATEQIIAKLRSAADGLVDNLLTCGIDKSGQLRDPNREPDDFTDTPLGRLPRNWTVSRLGEIVRKGGGLIQTGPFGSQLHAYDYKTSGVPVVMPQDINHGRISVADIARISENTAAGLSRHRVRPGDILFARRGDLTRCAEITEREASWLCGTGCLLVRLPQTTVRAGWLSAIYRHEIGQRHIRATAVGSTMPNLSGGILSRLLMPVPEVDEQVAIIRIIEAHRARLSSENLGLEKLRTTKAGLMSDLLTGRVRFPLGAAS